MEMEKNYEHRVNIQNRSDRISRPRLTRTKPFVYNTFRKGKGVFEWQHSKTVTVKGAGKTQKKIGKLKANKTYYVRIRTFMKVGTQIVYSDWSKRMKVKTK